MSVSQSSFSVDVMYYFVCTVLSKEKFAHRHNHVFYILYSAYFFILFFIVTDTISSLLTVTTATVNTVSLTFSYASRPIWSWVLVTQSFDTIRVHRWQICWTRSHRKLRQSDQGCRGPPPEQQNVKVVSVRHCAVTIPHHSVAVPTAMDEVLLSVLRCQLTY